MELPFHIMRSAGVPVPQEEAQNRVARVAEPSSAWHTGSMSVTVVMGKQGRLVVPSELRAALGLGPGDRLQVSLEGKRLVLTRPGDALEELRGLLDGVPSGRDLVAELIAERRAEAARE